MTLYRPRGSFVLLQVVDLKRTEGGVALPDISAEGKANYVLATGPDVKDLEPGTRVLIVGSMNESVIQVPREKGLLVTKAENCILAVEGVPVPEEIAKALKRYTAK